MACRERLFRSGKSEAIPWAKYWYSLAMTPLVLDPAGQSVTLKLPSPKVVGPRDILSGGRRRIL